MQISAAITYIYIYLFRVNQTSILTSPDSIMHQQQAETGIHLHFSKFFVFYELTK